MKPTKCEEQGRAAGNRPPTQSAATWMPTFTSLHAAFQKGFLHAPPHTFALQNYSETTPDHALFPELALPFSTSQFFQCLPSPCFCSDARCLLGLSLVLEDVAHVHPSLHPFTCSRGLLSFCLPKALGLYHCELFKPLGERGKPF